ncbi:hypothetical protein T440DRAFT_214196 [Plenodomus tracheiphilus IPT5]|uniref:Uncharacterized protein n=1 Tax=Plenodomus tracheiphilus IPT5 TaxID=1408161 RepID=A0A6A7AV65_9PLEO|nr:hypothetical protein T440DRAFT_214196 [Plenodomus tracheiphilus IPT5]
MDRSCLWMMGGGLVRQWCRFRKLVWNKIGPVQRTHGAFPRLSRARQMGLRLPRCVSTDSGIMRRLHCIWVCVCLSMYEHILSMSMSVPVVYTVYIHCTPVPVTQSTVTVTTTVTLPTTPGSHGYITLQELGKRALGFAPFRFAFHDSRPPPPFPDKEKQKTIITNGRDRPNQALK